MRREGEIHLLRRLDDAAAMEIEPPAIGVAQILRAAGHQVQLFLHTFKFDAAGKGQVFFRRIEHLDQVTAYTVGGEVLEAGDDLVGG